MFPYPSGSLHMGHVRVYTISDSLARYYTLRGFTVLHPMGWDAFGLPAENAAIERGTSPEAWTYANIKHMRTQLDLLGFRFDWDREVATCHSDYYRWTQWLFLRLHGAGLAYQKHSTVNWDPVDMTVLANEQVDAAGRSWRSGALVEQRPLKQWFFRLTAFADELLEGVAGLDQWPATVRTLQQQWIGRRNHARVLFPLSEAARASLGITRSPLADAAAAAVTDAEVDADMLVTVVTSAAAEADADAETSSEDAEAAAAVAATESTEERLDLVLGLEAYTTRPDTLCGVTYIALCPEGPVATALVARAAAAGVAGAAEAAAFARNAAACRAAPPATESAAAAPDTAGLLLPWLSVTHPLSGAPLPVFLARYAAPGKGTGVVMGVPAHDSNDSAFAAAHGLPVVTVVAAPDGSNAAAASAAAAGADADAEAGAAPVPYTGRTGTLVNSGEFSGLSVDAAAVAIAAALEGAQPRPLGRRTPRFQVRDWLVSRQRFWGTPIPIIHCGSCGPVPVPESQLPVALPEGLALTGRGPSPLASQDPVAVAWRHTACPCCGAPAQRETDTLDTFIDSSWYFLRFLCSPEHRAREAPGAAGAAGLPWSTTEAGGQYPVAQYIGGVEHAILHLLYARFIAKALHKQGLADAGPAAEPFRALLAQGMVHGESYKDPDSGRFVPRSRVAIGRDPATGEHCAYADPALADVPASAAATPAAAGAAFPPPGGKRLSIVWEKMSKSKYNGTDPVEIVSRVGADVARLYILFKAPPEKVLDWDDKTVQGTARWANRLWMVLTAVERAADERARAGLEPLGARATRLHRAAAEAAANTAAAAAAAEDGGRVESVETWLQRPECAGVPASCAGVASPGLLSLPSAAVHAAVGAESPAAAVAPEDRLSEAELSVLHACAAAARAVTAALDARHFNVAISSLMILSNELGAFLAPQNTAGEAGAASVAVYDAARVSSPVVAEAAGLLFQLLSPMAPHLGAEAFGRLRRATLGLVPAVSPAGAAGDACAEAPAAFFDVHAQPWPTALTVGAAVSAGVKGATADAAAGASAASLFRWEGMSSSALERALPSWVRHDAQCVVQVNGKKLAAIPVPGELLAEEPGATPFAEAIMRDGEFLTALADALRGTKAGAGAALPPAGVPVTEWNQLGLQTKRVIAKVTRKGATALLNIAL
jgi:leucyl-tRNA synthetase